MFFLIHRSVENLRSLADCIASSVMDLDIESDAIVDRTSSDTASEVDAVRQTYKVSGKFFFFLNNH